MHTKILHLGSHYVPFFRPEHKVPDHFNYLGLVFVEAFKNRTHWLKIQHDPVPVLAKKRVHLAPLEKENYIPT